jgi:hypothetical protein
VPDPSRDHAGRRPAKGAATVVALLAPFLLLLVIGGISGSFDLGAREGTFVVALWVVGLALVWSRRKPRPPAG